VVLRHGLPERSTFSGHAWTDMKVWTKQNACAGRNVTILGQCTAATP
jgi:hypothetical protein